jgi:Icc-related predicted phosphoesterase
MTESNSKLRIAAVADLHFTKQVGATLMPVLEEAVAQADVLLVCGDLTHHGLPEEAAELAKVLTSLRKPILAVLGNHDCHNDQQDEIKRVLADSPIHILDGEAVEIRGVGFAGTKGFAGGFGQRVLEPWGEAIVRSFVRVSVEETMKLESSLAQIRSRERVALLHYAPIQETVEGEPPEIWPFLGSSRLEEPLDRFNVTAVFHGHAHHGRLEGRTRSGVPVYNVSLPLMLRSAPSNGAPFRLLEIETSAPMETRDTVRNAATT